VNAALRTIAALLVSLVALCAPGSGLVRAGGADPRLSALRPEVVFTGGVVEVTGVNFSDAVEDVRATVGGEAAFILEARVSSVKLKLPENLAKGSHDVVVEVAGRRSNALPVKVVPQSERTKEDEAAAKKYSHPESSPLLAAKIVALLPPVPVDDRGSFYIQVSGEARLPDGCVIALALKLGDEIVTTINLPVKDKVFQGAFGPYTQELFAGHYFVTAEFDIQRQTKALRTAFTKFFPDTADRSAHEHAHDTQACRVGNSAQEVEQERQVREHVAESLARALRLTRRIENAFASAGRGAFMRDGKVDETGWEAWLAMRSLRNVPKGERAARIEEFKRTRSFAAEDGIFREAKWREWLDFAFRPDVQALAKRHIDYRNRYLVIKYPDAMIKLEEIFGNIQSLTEARSRQLYQLVGIPPPPQDGDADGGPDMIKLGGTTNVTPGLIEASARKVARLVALTPEEEAMAQASLPLDD